MLALFHATTLKVAAALYVKNNRDRKELGGNEEFEYDSLPLEVLFPRIRNVYSSAGRLHVLQEVGLNILQLQPKSIPVSYPVADLPLPFEVDSRIFDIVRGDSV
jgi:hypothetical protein